MKLTAPTPGLIYNMSIFDAFIVPKSLVTKEGSKFWNNPVGTGPFKLSKWVRGSVDHLREEPLLLAAGSAYLNTVTYQYALNDNTRLLDVENNQAQMADGIAFNQVATVKGNSNLTLQSVKVPYWVGLWMNFKRKPFQNLDVRKALEYAINRPLINKTVFDNLGTIPNSVLPQLKFDAPATVSSSPTATT